MAKNTAEDIIKTENAIAGEWMLNYHARLDEYNKMCANFSVLAGTVCDDMPHSTDTGDPCSKKAVALAQINEYKAWLEVVELAETTLSEKSLMFVRFRRLALDIKFKEVGRPGWIDYTSAKFCKWHYDRYGVDSTPARITMIRWWNTIADVVARLAIRNGLL